jgi:hypothetical protein
MIGKDIVALVVRGYAIFGIMLLVSGCASTKLLEVDKVSNFLALSREQLEVVQPKIETIKGIVDNYNAEKENLEAEINQLRRSRMSGGGYGGSGGSGGGQSGSREEIRQKIQGLREEESKSQRQVDVLVADIKALLTEEQLEKFEKIELPKLEMREYRLEKQGGGGRRGGGGRSGGRGPSF